MNFCVLFLLLISACSTIIGHGSPKQGKKTFSYTDASGTYVYTRETRLLKNKLIARTQISSAVGSAQKILEKSVMVTELGSVKSSNGRVLVSRPFASEFNVWLEGKRYDSKMRLDPRTKSLLVDLVSPEEKWKGRESYPVPKGTLFCFFSQIPECLYHNLLLSRSVDRPEETFSFYVVWDSFPYIQEQFSGVGMKLFAPAVLKYEGEQKSILRFTVDVSGQSVLYHLTKSFDLVRMLWVAQGISILPPGEEQTSSDE